ncbi:Colanic acid biosynthesis glycosyl transferase WcaA [Kosakonia radicincitans]|nr:Colanic acid biosynthesis glycosyl transferase WcaA [Kosakonia radicincitans]
MSTTANPLISIYMPTWNRQQLAIRAIKSVLRQDYPHWEMIVVDDCSTRMNNCNSLLRSWVIHA